MHRVRYLIVGGEAVIFYGHVRLTGDTDIFYDRRPSNAARLFDALTEFWGGSVPGIGSPHELCSEGQVIQFGRPPHRIDLLNEITGVSFVAAWRDRVTVTCRTASEAFPVYYIGLRSLILNKRALGRPKDLDDLTFLNRLARRQQARFPTGTKTR